jgi:hypothetical protein
LVQPPREQLKSFLYLFVPEQKLKSRKLQFSIEKYLLSHFPEELQTPVLFRVKSPEQKREFIVTQSSLEVHSGISIQPLPFCIHNGKNKSLNCFYQKSILSRRTIVRNFSAKRSGRTTAKIVHA